MSRVPPSIIIATAATLLVLASVTLRARSAGAGLSIFLTMIFALSLTSEAGA